MRFTPEPHTRTPRLPDRARRTDRRAGISYVNISRKLLFYVALYQWLRVFGASETILALGMKKPLLLDRLLFPKSQIVRLLIVVVLSGSFAYSLTGKQISSAQWGLIDDHEVFKLLDRHDRLPPSEIWRAVILKTTEGQVFRPAYYLTRVLEISVFGSNVHLWYLLNTACFAIFLGCLWWIMWPFAGGWLSGALTAYIALLPLWAGVWSRLGPSEIYGAACLGVMLLSSKLFLTATDTLARNVWAIALTLVTIAFIGMKETFLPFMTATAFLLFFAGWTKRLPLPTVVALSLLLFVCAGGLAFEIERRTGASGTDYYGRPVGIVLMAKLATWAFFEGGLRTFWILFLPVVWLRILGVFHDKSFPELLWYSRATVAFYLIILAMYAGQCGLYRTSFPTNMRYDFPAMLLIPATCCLVACDVSKRIRDRFPEMAASYAHFVAAAFLIFAMASVSIRPTPALLVETKNNINRTSAFFDELKRIVVAAKEDSSKPIILEAHSAVTYEPVISMLAYLRALGADNPISIRNYPNPALNGTFYEGLQRTLDELQTFGGSDLIPLETSLAKSPSGCLSVGIFGPADAACLQFQIEWK